MIYQYSFSSSDSLKRIFIQVYINLYNILLFKLTDNARKNLSENL